MYLVTRTKKIYDWIMENRATFGELAAIHKNRGKDATRSLASLEELTLLQIYFV